jgi:hypothetical protein
MAIGRKHIRILFLCFAPSIVGGLLFAASHHRASYSIHELTDTPNHGNQRVRHEIRGFHYDADYKGKTTISIKADTLSIQKKKLGAFRFALMDEPTFKNAVIHIYGEGRSQKNRGNKSYEQNEGREDSSLSGEDRPLLAAQQVSSTEMEPVGGDFSTMPGKKLDQAQDIPESQRGFRFNDIFSEESLPPFPVKRVSSVVLKPITIEVHDEDSVVTKISASSGIIRLKQRDILFKGNVRVISGSQVLTTELLSMLPQEAVLKTDRHFILKTPEKQWNGNRLTTDIFLRPIAHSSRS